MEIICLHDEAFFALLDEVIRRVKEKEQIKEDKWISASEAMASLGLRAKQHCKNYAMKARFGFRNLKRKSSCTMLTH